MQKTILLAAALMLSLFISGCGGGSTSVSIVASTNDTLTASDIFGTTGHTLSVTASKGTSSATFHTYSGVTRHDWNSDPLDSSVALGTWSVSNGVVTFVDTNNTPVKTITGIQKVYTDATKATLGYWLVTALDGTATQSFNCRMYIDSTTTFGTYTSSTAVKIGLMGGAIQKTSLPATFSNVSTVVGITGKSGFQDYTSAQNKPAQFGNPGGITTMDGSTFFVVDRSNNLIRMVYPENGVMKVRTVPLKDSAGTTVTLNSPNDITTDGTSLYVADTSSYQIRKITLAFDGSGHPSGTMTSLAGTGASGSIDGTGNTTVNGTTTTGTARFAYPVGITTDGTNLYVTDNHAIRKVVISTGAVTTLAGSPGSAGWTDDTGTAARFNLPIRITTDGTNLYVTDTNNYIIRQVAIATRKVTTIAGVHGTSGDHNDIGTKATFSGPEGITTDGTALYVTDWGRVVYGNLVVGQTIRRIELTSGNFNVTTIAGTSGHVNVRDGNGNLPDSGATKAALDAYFYCPAGIITDGTSLFVADALNYTIRKIK